MHNIISHNQLAYWTKIKDPTKQETTDKIDDYFECLTECDDSTQSCKRICRLILA